MLPRSHTHVNMICVCWYYSSITCLTWWSSFQYNITSLSFLYNIFWTFQSHNRHLQDDKVYISLWKHTIYINYLDLLLRNLFYCLHSLTHTTILSSCMSTRDVVYQRKELCCAHSNICTCVKMYISVHTHVKGRGTIYSLLSFLPYIFIALYFLNLKLPFFN